MTSYFPEKHLCQWFRGQGQDVAIYCFERTGVQPLLEAYRVLVARLGVDTVILILYRAAMLETRSYMDINNVIDDFRLRCAAIRPPIAIPL